jgi:hypothetical protein
MLVVLDHWAFEPPLPNMTDPFVPPMMSPRVSYSERLHNATNRLARPRGNQEMEVIAHQAIAIQPERVLLLGMPDGIEKGAVIIGVVKNGSPIITAIDGMV